MFRFLFAFCLFCLSFTAGFAIETKATHALLKDLSTGTILFEKNADQQMPTSSLSKVMSMYVVFERLRDGDIKLEDRFLISEKAWRKPGSKTFVKVGDRVLVEDLIKGTIVQSGNDATIALAEGISGSEDGFVELLNEKCKEFGMQRSHFVNATGWPEENHYSTPRDLIILSERMIQDFPEYYQYYSQKEFTYNAIKQMNRNPLLYHNVGADGLKTGQTEIAGMGIIGTATQNGRRLVLVLNGLKTKKERAQESLRLLEWGFREFKNVNFAKANEPKAVMNVRYGKKAQVQIAPKEDVVVTVMKRYANRVNEAVMIEEEITAPITTQNQVGKLVITAPEMQSVEIALYPLEDVDKMNVLMRLWTDVKLFFKKLIG